MFIGVAHEEWRLYECSDCHPDHADDDDEGEKYERPYQVAFPFERVDGSNPENAESSAPVDFCPRCGSYLSLGDAGEAIVVLTRDAKRLVPVTDDEVRQIVEASDAPQSVVERLTPRHEAIMERDRAARG